MYAYNKDIVKIRAPNRSYKYDSSHVNNLTPHLRNCKRKFRKIMLFYLHMHNFEIIAMPKGWVGPFE